VERWLGRLAPGTAKKSRQMFNAWMRWVQGSNARFNQTTPDELVSYQRSAGSESEYDVLDEIVQPYIVQKSGTHSYLSRLHSNIRSFFLHNRAELPKDKAFRIRPDKERVRGDLSIEDFRKIVLSSNEMYQATFLSMFQGGMDLASFEYWNLKGWPSLYEQLHNKDPMVVRVDLPGRKSGRNIKDFYTFIGHDAIKALRNYLPNPLSRGREAIFINRFGGPVKKNAVYQYWLRHLRRLGLAERKTDVGHRTGKNPHEMRDTFRSRWRISGVDVEVAEFFMGHDLDKLGYDKSPEAYPEWFEEQYLEAGPWLNVMTQDPQKVSVKEVHNLRMENRRLEEEIKKAQDAQNQKIADMEEQLRLIQEYMRKKG